MKTKRVMILAFLFGLLVNSSASSQEQHPLSQKPETALSLWNSPVVRTVLSNGIPVYFQRDVTSAVTYIQILIHGGKGDEPAGQQGVSYLTTRLTLEIPDQETLRRIMGQSTQLLMISNNDHSLITAASLSANLEEAIKVISEILFHPLINNIRIERNKDLMDYLRETEADDAVQTAFVVQTQNLFGTSPYAGSVYGTEESVKSLRKKDIEDFFKGHFRKGNLEFVVCSDLEAAEVMDLLEKHFDDVPEGELVEPVTTEPSPEFLRSENIVSRVNKDTLQSLVSLAFSLPPASPETIAQSHLLACALGKGFGSRMWPLRAEQKLAYNINARLTPMKKAGLLELYLETDAEKTDSALDALKTIVQILFDEGMETDELEMTRTFAKADFLRQNESKEIRTRTLAFWLALGMDPDFLEGFFTVLDAVTVEDMNVFIRTYLKPDSAVSLIIGPESLQDPSSAKK
ncbi:MAG: insulinase family protein [Acidobacteria bacterium]|nr:insulinase family protein [Acidobacteriota bacterium]